MDWNYKFEIEDNEDFETELKVKFLFLYLINFFEIKDESLTSGVIFVIDCNKNLFEKYLTSTDNINNCNTWFQSIIKSCLSVVKNKAMTTDKDNISIVFYRVV